MFAPAAFLIGVLCCVHTHVHAHIHNANFTDDVLDSAITFVFGKNTRWPRQVAHCAQTLGPTKCIQSFTAWRAANAIDSYRKSRELHTKLDDDLNKFQWQKYINTTEDSLTDELADHTETLLQMRSLKFSMLPGYLLELGVKQNGALNVDVYKNDEQTENSNGEGRGPMKKLQKRFYILIPLMMLPGLLMSAVLPFLLPSLKMLTIGAGMLNQMALTGAIFTLLRNNAFNDYYEKKVIYVNSGYKNEKKRKPPLHIEEEIHTHSVDDGFYMDGKPQDFTQYSASNNYDQAEEQMNPEWLTQYYGADNFGKVIGQNNRNLDTRRRTRLKDQYEENEQYYSR